MGLPNAWEGGDREKEPLLSYLPDRFWLLQSASGFVVFARDL